MKEMIAVASDTVRVRNWRHRCARYGNRRRGAIGIMFAMILPVLIALYGLALDLARIYSRKAEMQSVAETTAVAAAKKLNGTADGITAALAAAKDVLETGESDFRPRYGYVNTMTWSDSAITFSKSADGSTGWLDSVAASANPRGLAFVKVDTSALDSAYGKLDMLFIPVLSSSLTTVKLSHTAVAGKRRIKVTPFGICDMTIGPNHITSRPNSSGVDELVEYGFRRGVGYNLMNLNPRAQSPGANFLIDPVVLVGGGNKSNNLTTTAAPYVCTGTMAVAKLIGETVNVQSGFPLSSLVNQLNSRFDTYSNGSCDPSTAPPDSNVKQYTAASLGWMNTPKPSGQTAAPDLSVPNRLQTKAELSGNTLTAATSGVLWAYTHAVKWSSYTAGQPEPAGGYSPFTADSTTWNALYGTTLAPGNTTTPYPTPTATATPYVSLTTPPPTTTHRPGVANRRVLNVPILDCSTMPVSTARVLAIGKFFMTVPAVAGATPSISGEFAGATTQLEAGGPVEIVQ